MMVEDADLGASAGGGVPESARVAYFTMEVALDDALPTFSGGLGVLAGDYLRSAADLGLPVAGVTLLYRDGYFCQRLDEHGRQLEQPVIWDPASLLEKLDAEVEIEVGSGPVHVGAWRLLLEGVSGAAVPVYFLDTDLPANTAIDRRITDSLYGGDEEHRLRQEVVLGEGGVAMLRALGHSRIETFHMNEGHSALLTLRLFAERQRSSGEPASEAARWVRERSVFTTHTPVPAGHDRFPIDLVKRVLGEERTFQLEQLGALDAGVLNMTDLGARLSRYVNAVSRRHRDVAQRMLPGFSVTSVTNGVHVARWASAPMAALFDHHLSGWRRDSSLLRYAALIPTAEVGTAHDAAKAALVERLRERTGGELDGRAFTIGLARRVTPYKRTMLLFSDLDRLRAIAASTGPLQVVVSGKAHPRDEAGKAVLGDLASAARMLEGAVRVVFVENYDLEVAASLCAGADLWLNTPQAPNEASGTSGMKAALNGVPSLSVLDGWWIEGCIDGVTGWSIGEVSGDGAAPVAAGVARDGAAASDADALYERLERVVLPLYWEDREGYLAVRRYAIALNGSFFSTDRMAREYALEAYGFDEVTLPPLWRRR